MKRVIALLMENQPGALSRVVGLFSQRGYNIETLVVAPTTDPTLSRLTMSTEGDEKVVEQITKQLNKLIDVVMISDLSDSQHIEKDQDFPENLQSYLIFSLIYNFILCNPRHHSSEFSAYFLY